MKKNFILLFSGLLSFQVAGQSQGLRIGAHFGLGQATIKDSGIPDQTGKLALLAGVATNYQFFKNFGLYANILGVSKGLRASGTEKVSGFFTNANYTYEEKISLIYLEVPVMPKVSIGIGEKFFLKAFGGPSLNFNLHGEYDKVYDDENRNSQYGFTNKEIRGLKLLEIGLVYGGGFDVEISDNSVFSLEGRFSNALNSFGKVTTDDSYNEYFAVGIGYLYKY